MGWAGIADEAAPCVFKLLRAVPLTTELRHSRLWHRGSTSTVRVLLRWALPAAILLVSEAILLGIRTGKAGHNTPAWPTNHFACP